MAHIVEVVKNTHIPILGENPIWHPEEKVLYWVNITGGEIHRYNVKTEKSQTIEMGCMIGTVATANGNYSVLVALETGIYGLIPFLFYNAA